jgi:D-alanine-D-alanine ligase
MHEVNHFVLLLNIQSDSVVSAGWRNANTMNITILHNKDSSLLEDDPGREARADVENVASAIHTVLSAGKHDVQLLGIESDVSILHRAFSERRPDVVLNLCESLAADSRGEMLVPALLELIQVPCSGSSALSLALALHKNKAKEILKARGVPTPDFRVVETLQDLARFDLAFPCIVKPSREDASMGIDFDSVVHNQQQLGKAVTNVLRTFKQPALVEQFIAGREIYVPILGNNPRRALPLSEIKFGNAFIGKPNVVSYAAKWDTESAVCIESPSEIVALSPELEARCIEVAFSAFESLECRDYGRVDLRVDENENPYVIDINPNCDLHPQAGFARAALAAGISYADLALHLVEQAWERRHGHSVQYSERQTRTRNTLKPHRDLHAGRSVVRAGTHRRVHSSSR